MTLSRQELARQALRRSIEVRRAAKLDINRAIDPFDLCDRLGIKVRFVEVSMEGLYKKGKTPRILLSSLRPLVRRVFNCGHEVGHWAFGHGTRLDSLIEGCSRDEFHPDEFLVDTFSGFLLMPPLGVRKAFARRGWKPETATPDQFYTVACSFGVGYDTLIEHCAYSLGMLSRARAEIVGKESPKQIRERILGRATPEPLVVVDTLWELPTIDVEVGTLISLPATVQVEGDLLEEQSLTTMEGRLFRATGTGIGRIVDSARSWAAFVRVTRFQFAGLCSNRHLEDPDHDDE